eukprot:tig00000981_g5864.t1
MPALPSPDGGPRRGRPTSTRRARRPSCSLEAWSDPSGAPRAQVAEMARAAAAAAASPPRPAAGRFTDSEPSIAEDDGPSMEVDRLGESPLRSPLSAAPESPGPGAPSEGPSGLSQDASRATGAFLALADQLQRLDEELERASGVNATRFSVGSAPDPSEGPPLREPPPFRSLFLPAYARGPAPQLPAFGGTLAAQHALGAEEAPEGSEEDASDAPPRAVVYPLEPPGPDRLLRAAITDAYGAVAAGSEGRALCPAARLALARVALALGLGLPAPLPARPGETTPPGTPARPSSPQPVLRLSGVRLRPSLLTRFPQDSPSALLASIATALRHIATVDPPPPAAFPTISHLVFQLAWSHASEFRFTSLPALMEGLGLLTDGEFDGEWGDPVHNSPRLFAALEAASGPARAVHEGACASLFAVGPLHLVKLGPLWHLYAPALGGLPLLEPAPPRPRPPGPTSAPGPPLLLRQRPRTPRARAPAPAGAAGHGEPPLGRPAGEGPPHGAPGAATARGAPRLAMAACRRELLSERILGFLTYH